MTKKAIILGGTKGLGLAISHILSENNVEPIILGSSAMFEENVNHYPPNAHYQELNLLDDTQIKNVNFSAYGTIDYFFWVAGLFLIKKTEELTDIEIETLTKLHITSPIKLLRKFKNEQKLPCHYVTIASSSSWKLREHQALYCAVKAAKAAFMRNYANDLALEKNNSKVLLINPGGLNTPNFHKNYQINMGSNALNPEKVSQIIWQEMCSQQGTFKEIQLLRNPSGGEPFITYGPNIPETIGE